MNSSLQDAPRPTGALAKKSLLYVPIFGFGAWLGGTVFIDRKSYTAINIMQELVGKLKRNKVWYLLLSFGIQEVFEVTQQKWDTFVTEFKYPNLPRLQGNPKNSQTKLFCRFRNHECQSWFSVWLQI